MKKHALAIALASLVSTSANASAWKGSGEAGVQLNGGNTDTQTINLGLGLERKATIWGHEVFLGFNNNESNDVETADSKKFDYTAKRDLSSKSFLFGNFNYLDDSFDGFTDTSALAFGYGYRVYNSDKVKLELGAGIGYRDLANAILDGNGLETSGEGDDLSGINLVGTLDYSNKLTPTTELYNKLRIEPGEENTYLENEIGILVNISDAYSLKAAYSIRNNSEPSPGSDSTDTQTVLNLVYNFGK